MDLLEILKDTFMMIRSAKLRSALTMLGIIIGISAVIILTSIGKGQTILLKKAFDKMGNNIILIKRNRDYSGKFPITRRNYFTIDDALKFAKNPNIALMTPFQQVGWRYLTIFDKAGEKIELGKKSYLDFLGVSPNYIKMSNIKMLYGRNYTSDEKNNFTVIGNVLAMRIFGTEDCIGQKIKISFRARKKVPPRKFTFVVVGVFQNPQVDMTKVFKGSWIGLKMFIPVKTFMKLAGTDIMGALWCKVKDGINIDDAGDQLITEIAKIKDSPKEIYMYKRINEWMAKANDSVKRNSLFVALIAAISLLVGGIGIMNIMLVTVTERTREIGIRKAVGAKKKDIMFQFLIEAAMLTLAGGVVGIIIGVIGGKIIGQFMDVTPVLDYTAILVSAFVSILIGIIFGIYPAKKASELDPIVALRHE